MTAAEYCRLESRLEVAESLFTANVLHGRKTIEIRTQLQSLLQKVTMERLKAEMHEFDQSAMMARVTA